MTLRRSRFVSLMFNGLAFAGAAGTFVFGVLAGEGGRGHVRNIVLGVLCAMVPLAVGVASGIRASRRLRAEVEARKEAISGRERALESKLQAEAEVARIQVEAEAQLIFALRARLSSILYLLGTMTMPRPNAEVGELLGRLTQAVLAAAVVNPDSASSRRSIFFRVSGDKMECAGYAGPEGHTEAARTVFARGSDDPLGAYMFRVLDEGRAVLVPDVAGPDVSVRFPQDRSYQTAVAVAVTAGDTPYGILTLDAAEANTLGKTDLEIIKTLASLLGVGLALASGGPRRRAGTVK
jgi:GAF domain